MTIQEWIDAGRPLNSFILGDCMDLMKTVPDKFFELAICDPPYGIGASKYIRGGTQYGKSAAVCNTYEIKDWDKNAPDKIYFEELFRISKNQMIFGANHFISKMPFDASCWIIWDKKTAPGSGYADCELLWTSFKKAVRKIEIQWSGMLQSNMKEKQKRIHPTQKPIQLYRWLLQNYAKPGDKIFDSHVGSASSLIACMEEGFDYIGCELDKDYYKSACERIKIYRSQLKLF